MNELQKKELDMLKVCLDICKKLNLRYYLVCGSALGAAKYSGFIPWDDDLDVGLPRPDYEIFLKEAPALLPKQIFLQNYKTDAAYCHIFSKLRDSDTTWIETGVAHLPMNHGVYIDIFPLDGYPHSSIEKHIFEWRKKILTWKTVCALKGSSTLKVRVRNFIFRILGYHKKTSRSFAKMDALFKKYPPDTSEIWCNHGNWQGKLEYAHRSQYGKGREAVFEGIDVVIPEDFDAYLTQKYGEWRKDPPAERMKSHHSIKICDLHRSYREYI